MSDLTPWLTPLRGKIPVFGAWQALPPVDEPTVREWADIGYNLGLRTGSRSGVIVIDDDQARSGVPEAQRWIAPPTGLVAESPTGGRHYYYVAPDPCPGNSASKIAPYVDVRGEGGQVVFPGSSHPVLKLPYRWVSQGAAAPLPDAVLALLRGPEPVRVDLTAHVVPVPRGAGYGRTALLRESAQLRAAGPGTRNDRLNRAAFNLGQLVAAGKLTEAEVVEELTSSAKLIGDGQPGEDRKIAGTIRSGLEAGRQTPRAPRTTATATAAASTTPAPTDKREVLVPGSHVLPGGEYVEQGSDVFTDGVLRLLPGGALYRRAETVGEIASGSFVEIRADRLRSVVDENLRLTAGKAAKSEDEEPQIVYRPCSKDHANLILGYAGTHGQMRELRHIARHPVCIGPELDFAAPGWNASANTYLACDSVPDPLPLETARAVLEDLVCDFPFATPADRANYFGLLLTPILRPAIGEPVPMHLIGSPIERSGKTKLAEIVLGCAILGDTTPALQLGGTEDEREKRIMSLLLSGASIAHLDNMREFVDSPALASLLTSTRYQGRILGESRMVSCPNGLTLVASGNNVHTSGELAKRCVPIILRPPTETPETRDDYRHPLLRAYVESVRENVLAALLGLVAVWRDQGRPMGSVGFGGFERWAAVVGGIMRTAGYPEWLDNMVTWRGEADDFGDELRSLVAAWHERWACEWVNTSDIYDLADGMDLFARQTSVNSDRGRRTAFGQRVLSRAVDRVVGEFRIMLAGRGKRRRARLERV